MRNRALALGWIAGLACLGGATLVSCKEGTTLSGESVIASPDFEPTSPTVAAGYVSLRKGQITGSRVIVEVDVTEVAEPISGLALKLSYPASIARFVSCTDGDLLPQPGKCYFPASGTDTGTVFIGRTITAPQPSVPASGTKTIVRLEFLVFARGEGPLVFQAQNLGGGDASALLDADGQPIFFDWFAGKLVGK